MGTKCDSTEDMLRSIQDANVYINSRGVGRVHIMSMDVRALYPSLEVVRCRQIIEEVVEDSDIKQTNFNWKEVAKYLAVVYTPEQLSTAGLMNVIPVKVKKSKVTLAFLEKENYPDGSSKWNWEEKLPPTDQQKSKMLAMLLGEAVSTVMNNHLYVFDSIVYRQARGGPIGLELTGVIADIVMVWFDKHFLEAAKKAGINLILYKRYVDDVNMAVELPETFYHGDESIEEMEKRLAEWLKYCRWYNTRSCHHGSGCSHFSC